MHHRNRLTRRARLAVLAAPLLTLLLLPPAAQAEPRSPDPERVVVPQAPASRSTASQKAPATLDYDVYASANSPSFRTYFITAGHLKLSLRSGSTTRYTGTFVDYVGGRSKKATADASDPTAPVIAIRGTNGAFTFTTSSTFGSDFTSGTATKVPSKLGIKAKDVSFVAVKHSLRTATYAVVLTQRSGPPNRPFEYTGSLTVAYDANSRISGGQVTVTNRKGKNVTHALENSGYFSTGYFYTVAKVDKLSMGLTGTFSGSGFSGHGFAGSGTKTTQWVLNGTA